MSIILLYVYLRVKIFYIFVGSLFCFVMYLPMCIDLRTSNYSYFYYHLNAIVNKFFFYLSVLCFELIMQLSSTRKKIITKKETVFDHCVQKKHI